jgi:hypothetical protein
MQRRLSKGMLKRMTVLLMSCLLMLSIGFAKEIDPGDYANLQGENVQLTAQKQVLEKEKDMYEKLYKSEQFWGNIKDIVILVAIVAL